MTLLERIGLYVVVPALALLVSFGLGWHAGVKHEAALWAKAVAAEQQNERDAIAKANQAEADLSAATATSDATADELEKAREALLAKVPPIAACTDTADDVGSLRRLIEPR